MRKALYIIEGPAGSGKTTLIKELKEQGYVVAPALGTIERPRAYNFPDLGAGLSLAKDMLHLTEAIMCPDEHVILDRGFVSQIVYGSFRSNYEPYFREHIDLLARNIRFMVDALVDEYCFRAGDTEWPVHGIPIFLGINIPPLEDLLARRAKMVANDPERLRSYYPFDPWAEYEVYLKAARRLYCTAPEWRIEATIIQGAHDVPRLQSTR